MNTPADDEARERTRTGQAVAAARKARRLTQTDLADQAAVSYGLVRGIEQGRRTLTPGVREAISGVIGPIPDGEDAGSGPELLQPALKALSELMDGYDVPVDPPAPVKTPHELRGMVQTVTAWRLGSRYSQLAEATPRLITLLTAATQAATGREQEELFGLLALAWRAADAIADKIGAHDLSGRATEMVRWSAVRSGDPLLEQMGAYVRAELFFSGSHAGTGLRVVDAAAGAAPRGNMVLDLAMYGALCMRGAVLAARAGLREEAADRMAEARTVAGRVPEAVYHGTAFGPGSARIHDLALAVEAGDPVRAIAVADGWELPADLPAERRSHFHIEAARAYCMAGQASRAVESLGSAHSVAPQHTRSSAVVAETVMALMRRSRTPPARLLQMAKWAGIL